MHLTLDPRNRQHKLHDAADLTSLTVSVPSPGDLPLAADAVTPDLGVITEDGMHVLLRCEALRRLAGPLADQPSWQSGYSAMLAYAGRQGWLTPDGSAVRAHCTATSGSHPAPTTTPSAPTAGGPMAGGDEREDQR